MIYLLSCSPEVTHMTTVVRSEPLFLSTLPGRYYYDPAIYEMELEKIFSSMWVCVGRADAISKPGAYHIVTIRQESITIARSPEGALHAFSGPLPVALEVWEGFIYLNLSDDPLPAADQLK